MPTRKKVEAKRVPPTLEQFAELFRMVATITAKIFKRMDRSAVQYWIGHEQKLATALERALLFELFDAVDGQIADWVEFYREVFGLELNPSTIQLPPEREGFGWIVVVAKGLTCNGVFEICAKRFKSWRYYDDLDTAVAQNDREPAETYAIRLRDRVEADEEHKNKSTNTAIKAGIKGITLLERMLLELWYHWKTSQHLDVKNLTLCSGSRYAGGRVPDARWRDDKFWVDRVHPVNAIVGWRVRETVSLP